MVIKGKSRTNGGQLAAYLLKLGGNERIQIIEHNSPHDTLSETFRDWEVLADGVDGKKYLYHAQINPEARYAMTPEQWERSADVLETELGFTGQPRVIVFHEKDDGRQHVHVVWNRIDPEKMSLLEDGWNYRAHERASMALELEFGHEKVLGKHEKRDREQQPDFPRAEVSHDEYQQGRRTGIDPKTRRAELQALKAAADNAQSFKAALEEAGYTLARGDRGYTLVDQDGEHYNLAKQLKMKIKDVDQFMKAVPLDSLPELEQEKQRAKTQPKQEPKKPEPPKPEEAKKETPKQPDPDPDTLTPEQIAKIETNLKVRHSKEGRELIKRHDEEYNRTKKIADDERAEKQEALRAIQKAERDKLYSTAPAHSNKWVKRFVQVLKNRWNPEEVERQKQQRERERQELRDRHRIERQTLIETEKLKRDQDLDDLKARQQSKQDEHKASYATQLKRYIEEEELAKRLIEEIEKIRQKEFDKKPDEPEPPKPSL